MVDADMRAAMRVAEREGQCVYLDDAGKVTLIDAETGKVKRGLTAQKVVALYGGKAWRD